MKSYPFPYLGHGSSYGEKGIEGLVWFEDVVPVGARRAVEDGVPAPVAVTKRWGSHWLHVGSDDAYAARVLAWLHGRGVRRSAPTAADWREVEARLERWIRGLHAERSIAFFCKTSDAETRSPWHKWSVEVFAERIAPRLERGEGDKSSRAMSRWVREIWSDEATPPSHEPDEKMTLGEIRLSVSAGHYPTARKLARKYQAAGGEMSPAILALLVVIHNFAGDAKSHLEFFELALERIRASKKNRYRSHAELVANVCWVLNEQKRFDEVLELVGGFPDPLTDLLEDRRLYAALNGRKLGELRRLADHVMAVHTRQPRFFRDTPTTVLCAAYAYAVLGDEEAMVRALRAARSLGCDLKSLKREAEFGPYRTSRRFLAAIG